MLKKSRKGYQLTEEQLDVEDSCWALICLLWVLDIIRYDRLSEDDKISGIVYLHQRDVVEMLCELHMDMCKHGAFDK